MRSPIVAKLTSLNTPHAAGMPESGQIECRLRVAWGRSPSGRSGPSLPTGEHPFLAGQRPLADRPDNLYLRLLGDFERIIYLDAEVSHCTFEPIDCSQ